MVAVAAEADVVVVVEGEVGLAAAVAAAAAVAICDVSPAAEEEDDAVDVLAGVVERDAGWLPLDGNGSFF